jgi:hypothetical protein
MVGIHQTPESPIPHGLVSWIYVVFSCSPFSLFRPAASYPSLFPRLQPFGDRLTVGDNQSPQILSTFFYLFGLVRDGKSSSKGVDTYQKLVNRPSRSSKKGNLLSHPPKFGHLGGKKSKKIKIK